MKANNQQSDSPSVFQATVTDLNHDGRGVARLEGKVVFIDGALPGETVSFQFLRRRKKYDGARMVEIIDPSPDRIEPPCEYYGLCGGCSLQHLQPEAQIYWKHQQLKSNLAHIARIEPQAWLDPVTGPAEGYRRKARLAARYVAKKGGALVGFRERHSSYITDMNACHVIDRRVAHLIPELREIVSALSCRDRLPQVELACGDDSVAAVFRHLLPLTTDDEKILRAFGEKHNIHVFRQPRGPDNLVPVFPEEAHLLNYHLDKGNVTIEFRPTDFTQVNHYINQQMVRQAVERMQLAEHDRVLDLFCGLGNFSLPLARFCQHVYGIEGDGVLVDRARQNARLNQIDNTEFVFADLYGQQDNSPWSKMKFNKVLLDPPRSGAMDVVKQLPHDSIERMVYISCNPATLARDSEYLVNAMGYKMEGAGVMDMFPHTSHVESIAIFSRNA